MEEDALKSAATSEVEDVVPELGTRLLHLQQERARCIKYAAALSGWSLFWTISLIAVGALVAAQGAFAKVWGNASWLTITFIAFGVFTAAGTGFNSFFKPGERSAVSTGGSNSGRRDFAFLKQELREHFVRLAESEYSTGPVIQRVSY